MSFAAATAVRDLGEGRYTAEVAPGWDVVGATNGGYLLALCGRALTAACGAPDPVAVTASFLSPTRAGAVEITTEVLRRGLRPTARARLASAAAGHVEVLGTVGDLSGAGDLDYRDGDPPDVTDVGRCLLLESGDPMPPPLMDRVALRLDPRDAGFAWGEPSGRALIRGWFGLRDDEPLSTLAVLLAADAFPPTVFNAGGGLGWTPTLQLSVYVRARPLGDLLACAFTTRFIGGGLVEVDGELWDGDRLVGQSRQLALTPRG